MLPSSNALSGLGFVLRPGSRILRVLNRKPVYQPPSHDRVAMHRLHIEESDKRSIRKSLRPLHAAYEVLEARVRADRVQSRVATDLVVIEQRSFAKRSS